jgi:hypothetical protein
VANRPTSNGQRAAAPRRNSGARRGPTWDEVQGALDAEVGRLPAPVRAAFVLCALEGKDQEEAGLELDCPGATVVRRLLRARALLQQRLGPRGIRLPALLAALALSEGDRGVPRKLARLAVRSGLLALPQIIQTPRRKAAPLGRPARFTEFRPGPAPGTHRPLTPFGEDIATGCPKDGRQPGVAGELSSGRLEDERGPEEIEDLRPGGWYTHRLSAGEDQDRVAQQVRCARRSKTPRVALGRSGRE